jgi:hypothetical protein
MVAPALRPGLALVSHQPEHMSDDSRRSLRESYDRRVDERDSRTAPAYELQERDTFLSLLHTEQKHSIVRSNNVQRHNRSR